MRQKLLYLFTLFYISLNAQNILTDEVLFSPLDYPATVSEFDSSTLNIITEDDDWSVGDSWFLHDSWSEPDVFHVELQNYSSSASLDWQIRIGKGGQLYSIQLPELGEIIPPQISETSPWNDDCMTSTLLGEVHKIGNIANYKGNAFIHGSSMYVIPEYDIDNDFAFYAPMFANNYNEEERSYSLINLGLVPTPSAVRGDAMFYTKYKDLGQGVIEITYYFYNFGEFSFVDAAVPWMGVRGSIFPDKIDGAYSETNGNYSDYSFIEIEDSEGNLNAPLFGEDLYLAYGSGGWQGYTQDASNPESVSVAMVHGIDKYWEEQRALRIAGEDYWQRTQTICNSGTAGSASRDFNNITTAARLDFEPGEGFFFRTFMVIGTLEEIPDICAELVDQVDYGIIDLEEAEQKAVYVNNYDDQPIFTTIENGTPIGYLNATPVTNSLPIFLMKEQDSGTYVVSPDPYVVCSKEFVTHDLTPDSEHYDFFVENYYYYRPFDNNTEWTELLGYAIPYDESKIAEGYQRLSEVLIDNNVSYVAGEKLEAHELMIWTGSTTSIPENNFPVFDSQIQLNDFFSVDESTTGNLNATDSDNDTLTYELIIGPDWLTMDSDGTFYGTPTSDDIGLNTWSVKVSDTNEGFDTAILQIPVLINSSLKGSWSFEDGLSGNDSSIYDRDLTITNSTNVSGIDGNSLELNSTSEVIIPASTFQNVNNEISICMWVNANEEDFGVSSILSAKNESGEELLNIHAPWVDGSIIWDAGEDRLSVSSDIENYYNTWNHFVFTKNIETGIMNIYINGVLVNTSTENTSSISEITSANLGIAYNGIVDEVSIYNVELSIDEIVSIYCANQDISIISGSYLTDLDDVSEDGWTNNTEITVSVDNNKIILAPSITINGVTSSGTTENWTWTGPNDFTSTGRVVNLGVITEDEIGEYEVTYSSSSGDICSQSQTFTVIDETTLSMDQLSNSQNNYQVYPNPTNNILNIDFPNNENINIEIVNLFGRSLINELINENNSSVDLTNLASGIYLVKISDQTKIISIQKIIKK